MELIVATNNKGKIKEIKEILNDVELITLKEAGIEIEVVEDRDTSEENSLKKAMEISKISGKVCIADDTGLYIDALGGFPGVQTARFLGENATQEERNEYLINKLKGITEREKRKAKVVTCIAFANVDGTSQVFRGEIEGYISKEKKGNNGFGFDEIFELEDGRTLAELDAEEKNNISSRKIALNKLKEYLNSNNR